MSLIFRWLCFLVIMSFAQMALPSSLTKPKSASVVATSSDTEYQHFFDIYVAKCFPEYRTPFGLDKYFRNYWSYKGTYVYKSTDDEKMAKAPFWTKGDFDGNGETDYSYILVNRKNFDDKILVVALSNHGSYSCTKIVDSFSEEMGVATQKRGVVSVISDIQTFNRKQVTLKHDSIGFFHFESAAFIYQWDDKTRSFVEYGVTD